MPTAARQQQRRQHTREHDQVRSVLDVDEPVSEVAEVQVEQREEVPPRLQEVPGRPGEEQCSQRQCQSIEADTGPVPDGQHGGVRQAHHRRIRRGRLFGPGARLERRLLEELLRIHVADVIEHDPRAVDVSDRVRAEGVRLLHEGEQRDTGKIDVLAGDPRDGEADDDEYRHQEDELLRSPGDRK